MEKVFFSNQWAKNNKIVQKIKKPCSLVLSIMLVLGIIFVVIFVVFPQLGKTILMLGESIQVFIPKLELWAEDLFQK